MERTREHAETAGAAGEKESTSLAAPQRAPLAHDPKGRHTGEVEWPEATPDPAFFLKRLGDKSREDIEKAFVEAGWELDGGFEGHLVIGEDHHLSILAHRRAWEAEGDPEFELFDGDTGTTHRVKEVPTPERAAMLLEEHGGPPEEKPSIPHGRRDA